jgi:hypothetical protein
MVVVGLGTGLADQPVSQLGVVDLLGAWLVVTMSRRAEAVGGVIGAGGQPHVGFFVEPGTCTLTVAGEPERVAEVLGRLHDGLRLPGAVEVSDGLRDRARAHGAELQAWRSHLAARWPGDSRLAHVLGPLALDALDADDLRAALDRLARAPRAYWTNDVSLADAMAAGGPAAPAERSASALASAPRSGPGCVVTRDQGQLFSIAMRDDPAGWIALAVLGRALRRRLVDFDAVATDVGLRLVRLVGRTAVACCYAAVVPNRGDAVRRAVVETFEDIAAGALSAEEIGRVRSSLVETERSADPADPSAAIQLVQRQLADGGFPLPGRLAADLAATSDDAVRAALAAAHRQLLLCVPPATATDSASLPFELAERAVPRPASGRRFRDWTAPARALRISPDRIGIVARQPGGQGGQKGRRRPRLVHPAVTLASVDVGDLLLRVDIGEQVTILIDRELRSVELVWETYRHATKARRAVDAATATLPVTVLPPDADLPARLADARRRRRRQQRVPVASLAVMAIVTSLLALHPLQGDHQSAVTLGAAATARLPNGTTLAIVAGPEMIKYYAPDPYLYALEVRVCGGREHDDSSGDAFPTTRNYFYDQDFELSFDDMTLPPTNWIVPARPRPAGVQLTDGECATGWLLFGTPAPTAATPPGLRYANHAGDQVTWSLPGTPALSPLSCPSPAPASTAGPVSGDLPPEGCHG